MKVKFSRDENVVVTMSHEELGVIRYALDAGVQKLESTASFLKVLGDEEYEGANKIAKKAKAASESLEGAVDLYLSGQ